MLVTILAFLFILAFSITIHEFGHFIVSKLFKIPVEKFSIGYGPPLIRKTIGETDFRIGYFPFGGYVKIAGDDEGVITENTGDTEHTEKNGSLKTQKGGEGFYEAPIYKRVSIVLAGPLFNIFSAFFVFVVVFGIYGFLVNPYMTIDVEPNQTAERAGLKSSDSIVSVAGVEVTDWDEAIQILSVLDGQEVSIGYVRDGSPLQTSMMIDVDSLGIVPRVPPVLGSLKYDGPAQNAGMRPGSRILEIDGKKVETWYGMIDIVRPARDVPLHIVWEDNGTVTEADVTPASFYDPVSGDTIGQIGAVMPLERKHLPLPQVITVSMERSVEVLWLTIKTLYQLIVGRISRQALGGPIAIARLSGESARWGFENLLGLLAVISINLGLINLFPIPALDGGHVVISVIEGARRKRFSRRTRMIIQQVGYALILLLIVFVTFNDITR